MYFQNTKINTVTLCTFFWIFSIHKTQLLKLKCNFNDTCRSCFLSLLFPFRSFLPPTCPHFHSALRGRGINRKSSSAEHPVRVC